MTELLRFREFSIWWDPCGPKKWTIKNWGPCVGIEWEFQFGPFIFRWDSPPRELCEPNNHMPIHFVPNREGDHEYDYYACKCRCVQYFGQSSLESAQAHWAKGRGATLVVESIEYIE